MKNWKYIIGIIIIAICIILLAFRGFKKSRSIHLSVSEALGQQDSTQKHPILVSGHVVAGSIDVELDRRILEFKLTDGKKALPIRYHGAIPEFLRDGKEIIVEGTFEAETVFKATKIIAK